MSAVVKGVIGGPIATTLLQKILSFSLVLMEAFSVSSLASKLRVLTMFAIQFATNVSVEKISSVAKHLAQLFQGAHVGRQSVGTQDGVGLMAQGDESRSGLVLMVSVSNQFWLTISKPSFLRANAMMFVWR